MNGLIGIPYSEGGRDYDGVDCWGLVYLYYRDQLGIELPRLDGGYDVKDLPMLADFLDESKSTVNAEPIDEPRDGDLVVMKFRGHPIHVGVYLDGSVLHVLRGIDSVMEPVASPRIRGRIEGYYRVR